MTRETNTTKTTQTVTTDNGNGVKMVQTYKIKNGNKIKASTIIKHYD